MQPGDAEEVAMEHSWTGMSTPGQSVRPASRWRPRNRCDLGAACRNRTDDLFITSVHIGDHPAFYQVIHATDVRSTWLWNHRETQVRSTLGSTIVADRRSAPRVRHVHADADSPGSWRHPT